DPRLGAAQKNKDQFYKLHGLTNDDDDDDDDDDSGYLRLPSKRIPFNLDVQLSQISKADELKRCKKHWKKQFENDVKNEAKNLKERDCKCAEAAIKFYNEKHVGFIHLLID
ncbi:hypothetical protein KSS87_017130, partial [Heliosperma pusillum]